ncbi:MAG TPA: hypothetical protein VF030_01740 [Solirubrobacterales bacterium]
MAIDAYGIEYVASYALDGVKGRIDVFDDEGFFITELPVEGPKGVAVDSEGNLYVYRNVTGIFRYTPTVYKPEEGEIEYGNPPVLVASGGNLNGLAIDFSNDRLYAANQISIEVYGSKAEGNVHLDTIEPAGLSWNTWVAVDSQRRRLYASACTSGFEKCVIRVFEADAPYAELAEINGSETPAKKFSSTKGWLSVAVDEETGHFYVDDLETTKNVYEFDQNYKFASRLQFSAFQGGNALQIAVSNSPLNKAAKNWRYLFVPAISPGAVFAFEASSDPAPEILGVSVSTVAQTEAELQATINPRNSATNYSFEYVTQQQFDETEFADAKLAGAGTLPAGNVPRQVKAIAQGLSPGTTYRFRVVAENVNGAADEEGPAFTTYSDAFISNSCPNQTLRIGASAALPDCRAYELVTPPDTNGRAVKGIGFTGDRFTTLEASPLGNVVSFTLEGGALPGSDVTGGINGDPYLATRGASGWTTASAGPSGTEALGFHPGSRSPDQGYSFWDVEGEGSAVVEGKPSHYVRYPDGHSDLVGTGSIGSDPTASGVLITEGGTHIVFQTEIFGGAPAIQLEPNAPPTGTRAVYDRTPDGVTHVVSLLPGNETPKAGEHAEYLGASRDGEGIAFEIEDSLYFRVGNAVTYKVGVNVDPAGERLAFAGASPGGDRIFYVEDEDLLAFDTSSEEDIEFTESGDVTVVNVAPSGTRAYFTSPSVLTGEANPNGDVPDAGEQNLYLSEEGAISFVGTVTDRDVEGEVNSLGTVVDGLGLWIRVAGGGRVGGQLAWDPSRLNPDGSVFLFQSRANLAGYDSDGFAQIYRYDSGANRLHCLSCIPTKAPATGGASLQTPSASQLTPPPSSPYGFVPNLSPDGKRVFFESKEALVSRDTDEVQDVYEWEEEGVGSCTQPGGCVYLITSGESARDNFLFAHSASGDDVFFTTGDILTGFDGSGTPSVYDARVGGGFPEPDPPICVGESCHPGLTPPPVLPSSESGVRQKSGNVTGKKSCPKGKRKVKRKGKIVCVKKKKQGKKKKGGKAGKNRGASK